MKRLLSALLVSVTLMACGGALKPMAQATAVAGLAISESREQLVQHRRDDLDACSDVECLDAVTLRWTGPIDLYETTRAAHSLLVDALVVYDIAGQSGASSAALRAAATALVRSASAMVTALRDSGVELPQELEDAFPVLEVLAGLL